MADEEGQGLGTRLDHFGREAERLVSPAGPVAARSRGEQRRRSRRRTALVAMSTAVLTAVGWGVMPGISNEPLNMRSDPAYTAAASVLPPPGTQEELSTASLLAPAALPWHKTHRWHVTEIGTGEEVPRAEVCLHSRWPRGSLVRAEVAASYSGGGGAYGQHRIVEYGKRAQAAQTFARLGRALRSCGFHETPPTTRSHAPAPDGNIEYSRRADGAPVRVAVVWRENRVAVLLVSARDHADTPH